MADRHARGGAANRKKPDSLLAALSLIARFMSSAIPFATIAL